MKTVNNLQDSSARVKNLIKHDLSVYDLKIDETHDTVAVTARYSYDLSKVYSIKDGSFKVSLPHDRIKEKLDEFITQVLIGIEHDLMNQFEHLKDKRPVTHQMLKEEGLIDEMLEFERLLEAELSTNTLDVIIRVRLTQMHENQDAVSGQFQYQVSLFNNALGNSEKILSKTEMMPFQNSADAELYAKRFLKNCQGS